MKEGYEYMMRKKGVLSIALIISMLAIMVSGTMAYFVSSDTAHNVITTSGVDIELIEKTTDDNGNLIDFPEEGVDSVVPGIVVDKIVSVKSSQETADCWVRIGLSFEITDKNGDELPIDGVMTLNYDTENWTEKDGLWYYNSPLSAGQETSRLFTTVTFSSDLGNEYQNATAIITIHAEAVQSKNNGSSALEAVGWPE